MLGFHYSQCETRYVQMILVDQRIVSKTGISLTLAFSGLYMLVKIVSIFQLTTQLN